MQSASSGNVPATPGVFPQGQSSPPLPGMSSQAGTAGGCLAGNVPSTPSMDMKTAGLNVTEVKEECKTPLGLGPMSVGSLPSTPLVGNLSAGLGPGSATPSVGMGTMPSSAGLGPSSGTGPLGFNLTMDKEEIRVNTTTMPYL